MTDKQKWISEKIGKLIGEGYKKEQAVAVAYSMYDSAHKKMQQGGWYESNTPMFTTQSNKDLSFSTNIDSYQPYIPTEQDRLNSLQGMSPYGDKILNFANEASDYPIQDKKINYLDNINYNLINPYTGVSNEQALFSLGQSLAYEGDKKGWNTARGVAGAGKFLLGSARTLMSGLSSERENQKVYEDMNNTLYSKPNPIIFQEGGNISKADYLTGNYIIEEGQGNVELEDSEKVKDNITGEIKTVKGDDHKNGGVNVTLEDAEVLSNYTKIGAKTAKDLKDRYNINAKKTDTFAKVLEKFEKRIGKIEEVEEQSKYIKKLEKVNLIKDETTKRLNEQLITKEIEESSNKIKELDKATKQLFDTLFKIQESRPKKGNGTVVLDDKGKPMMQEGGGVNSNYKKADYIQSGIQNEQLGKGYYIYNSDGTREFVTEEGLNKYKTTGKYLDFINRGGAIDRRVPGTEDKSYRPSDVIPTNTMSALKPLYKVQSGVQNEKLGSGYYLYYKEPTTPGFNVETDREFITNDAFNNIVLPSSSYQQMLVKKQGKQGLQIPDNKMASLYQEGGRIEELAKKYEIPLERAYQLLQEGGQTIQDPMQQLFQMVVQMLQQGMPPEQIAQQLVQSGVPEEQVSQIIQTVANQLQGQSPQEEQMEGGMSNQSEDMQEPMMQEGGNIVYNVETGRNEYRTNKRVKQSATEGKAYGEPEPQIALQRLYNNFPDIIASEFKDNIEIDELGNVNFKKNIPLNKEQEIVRNFQKKADSRMRDSANTIINNPNSFSKDQLENAKQYLQNETFLEKAPGKEDEANSVRGFDAKLGNFTSGRYSMGLNLVTPEDLNLLNKSGIRTVRQLKDSPILDKLSPDSRKRVDNVLGIIGNSNADYSINPFNVPAQNQEISSLNNQVEYQQRNINKIGMANLPVDYILPPSEMQSIYKPEISLQRIEPVKITPESMLAEQERLRLAQQEAVSQSGLPAQTQFAINAQGLASSQQSANDAISKAEQFNAQNQFQADQFNIGQSAKEELSNEQFNVDYQNKMAATIANQERDLRNYFTQLNLNQRQNFKDISNLNLTNAMFDRFKSDGSNITFIDQNSVDLAQPTLTKEQLAKMSPEQYKNFLKMQTLKNRSKSQNP